MDPKSTFIATNTGRRRRRIRGVQVEIVPLSCECGTQGMHRLARPAVLLGQTGNNVRDLHFMKGLLTTDY
jgi:hypothetical protein